MAGLILIVDGTAGQRILLRARLSAAFYQVITAESGQEALRQVESCRPDLVIAAADLPDMCGGGFCTRLRALPGQSETPLVLLSKEDSPEDRLALLAVGADDVIARPVEDILLLARLRSLIGRTRAEDDLTLREDTRRALGLSEPPRGFQRPARVTLISFEPGATLEALAAQLRVGLGAKVRVSAPEPLLRAGTAPSEAIVLVDAGPEPGCGPALLSQLRTARARHRAALVYVTTEGCDESAARALDLGADDVMRHGPDPLELALRLPRLIARARVADRQRAALHSGLRAAVVDPLTGLHNRRYALPQLARMAQQAQQMGSPLALLVADLDHFKAVNDRWGHAFGDRVLATTAEALRRNRGERDLVARLGGEEFLIALPDADSNAALRAARQICRGVAGLRLSLAGARGAEGSAGPNCSTPTISIGIALLGSAGEPVEAALRRADTALYAAKRAGRNRVHLAAAAALPCRDAGDGDGVRNGTFTGALPGSFTSPILGPIPGSKSEPFPGPVPIETARAGQSRGLRGMRRASSSSSASSRSA